MDLIDATELPQSEKEELVNRMITDSGGINSMIRLRQQAICDELGNSPRTITTQVRGNSPEDALGRSYKLRDLIEQHTDIDVSCSLTGNGWIFPSTTFYEIEIDLNK